MEAAIERNSNMVNVSPPNGLAHLRQYLAWLLPLQEP